MRSSLCLCFGFNSWTSSCCDILHGHTVRVRTKVLELLKYLCSISTIQQVQHVLEWPCKTFIRHNIDRLRWASSSYSHTDIHTWTDVLGLRATATTHNWRVQRKMEVIIIIPFYPFCTSFSLTSTIPCSSDGHTLSQKEECVCSCLGPLWCRDSMLNSILLQGLLPAYGHRTFRASWRHMPYWHKSLFFTCWYQNGSHTTEVKTYFLRTLSLMTLVGASITKNQEISAYKSHEV